MDISKPKPIHNWREFLKEYAIIVIGVLTALAAEQAVEWVHWRNEVAEARQILAAETAANVVGTITRLRVQACVERRLDQLGLVLDSASRTGSLPPVGFVVGPPGRGWVSGAWEGVLASQVSTHFSRQALAGLARFYQIVRIYNIYRPEEVATWARLSSMTGPGRRLDPASEAELRNALGLARTYNRNIANLSVQMLRNLKPLDLPFDGADKDIMAAARDMSPQSIGGDLQPIFQICRPMGAAPSQYGLGTVETFDLKQEGMKLLPDLGGR